MQLWGFENSRKIAISAKFSLLQHQGGAGGVNGRNNQQTEIPPPHWDTRTGPLPQATPEEISRLTNTAPGTDGRANERTFYIRFEGERNPQNGRLNPNPNQRWSYRGIWHERDGLVGISCKEEADEVIEFVNRIDPNNSLRNIDPNARISYLITDRDNNGQLDEGNADLQTIEGRAAHGREVTNPDGDGSGSTSGSERFNLNSVLAKLRADRRRFDREFDEIMERLMKGDTSAVKDGADLQDKISSNHTRAFGAMMLSYRREISTASERRERRLVTLMRSGNTNASTQAEIREIQFANQRDRDALEAAQNAVRDSTDGMERDRSIANALRQRFEEINRIGLRWG